jgi:hypothetical protein
MARRPTWAKNQLDDERLLCGEARIQGGQDRGSDDFGAIGREGERTRTKPETNGTYDSGAIVARL